MRYVGLHTSAAMVVIVAVYVLFYFGFSVPHSPGEWFLDSSNPEKWTVYLWFSNTPLRQQQMLRSKSATFVTT